jgi:hypothetical protein
VLKITPAFVVHQVMGHRRDLRLPAAKDRFTISSSSLTAGGAMHTDRRAAVDRLTLVYILGLGVLAALYRLVPYYLLHPDRAFVWNLVPVGALALFAGSRLRSGWAWLVPLGVMLVSDLLLWYPLYQRGMSPFSWLGTPIIYASFAVYVLVGRMIRQGELSPMVIGGAALLASVQFFLLTNFAVWLRNPAFPATPGGLLECYALGVPFYRNTLTGDLLFSALFFGLHAALGWLPAVRPAPVGLPDTSPHWQPAPVGTPDTGVTRRDEVKA